MQVAVESRKKEGKKEGKSSGKGGGGSKAGSRAASIEPSESGNDNDRWGFECVKCGDDGDLLCCEVSLKPPALLSALILTQCALIKWQYLLVLRY